MIDLHTHLFNARSLPLEGILGSRGVPPVLASLFRRVIHTVAADDRELDVTATALADASVPTPIRHHVRGIAASAQSDLDAVEQLMARIPQSLLQSDACDRELGLDRRTTPATDLIIARREALRQYVISTGFDSGSVGEIIGFIARLLQTERQQLEELIDISPDVELFIHHMMDMEYSYADVPDYEYVRQLKRMRTLAAHYGGRIVGFAAFEPFRPGAFRIVKETIENGFCGVKFYPPSGYRATDNIETGITPDSPRAIDRRNHELFAWCVEQDVPVFTHCTPGGMERIPGRTGAFSNPRYWQRLLSHRRYARLRLCFGHAGGDPGWFDPIPQDGGSGGFWNTYAGAVVRLCAEYPNVYCEFSHMEEVLNPEKRLRFAYWLRKVIGRFPIIASKIAYGSDFPMLIGEGGWHEYLPSFLRLFEETPDLRPHARAFFKTNALNFLNLPRFIERNRGVLTEGETRYLEDVIAGRIERDAADRAPRAATRASMTASMTATETAPTSLGTDPANPVDCLVLGAGVAGMTAAREIMKNYLRREPDPDRSYSVLVLEGSDRIGGRVHTLRNTFPIPVEVGAELIHRERPWVNSDYAVWNFWKDIDRYGLTAMPVDKLKNNARAALVYFAKWSDDNPPLLRPGCDACDDKRFKAGIDALDTANSYGRAQDETVTDFIERYICGKRGYCDAQDNARAAADYLLTGTVPGSSAMLSTASLRFDRVKEQEHSGEEYHVGQGYDTLPQAMASVENIPVLLGTKVTAIHYQQGAAAPVRVDIDDGRSFFGRTTVCSFSIGMLKSGEVTFHPPLPQYKQQALDRVEIGPESKVVLEFTQRFWPETMAILSNPNQPNDGGRSYFVPGYGRPGQVRILTAFLTRELAEPFDAIMPPGGLVDETSAGSAIRDFIQDNILADLSRIFSHSLTAPLDLSTDVVRFIGRSWEKDPFAKGATSFIRFANLPTEDVEDIREALASPNQTAPLFWAGEATATNTQPWSVHGAHASGARAAYQARFHLWSLG